MNIKNSIDNPKECLQFIQNHLKPKEVEKNKYGEVFTPMSLVEEMLDKLPEEVWSNSELKWFDPANGMGNFPIAVYYRLMKGLSSKIKNEEKRKKHIIENMLYMSELNKKNCFMTKQIFDPEDKYQLNLFEGDTLDLDPMKEWSISTFDIIMGNPPYNQSKEGSLKGGYGGRSLWDKFVEKSIDFWLKKNSLLLFIHPPSWRKPEHKLWDILSKKQLVYINCITEQDSKKLFGCSTIVDYYLLQNINLYKKTIIEAQDKKIYKIDLTHWKFLPSGSIDIIETILGENKVIYSRSLYGTDKKNIIPNNLKDKKDIKNKSKESNVIYSSSIYDTRKKYICPLKKKESKDDYYERCKTLGYTYPVIHNMTKEYGCGYVYSNENKGHFGVKKVVLSFGRHQYPFNDFEGKYGMSQICYGLEIDNKEEGDNICKAINSDKFKEILKYTKWSTFQTDWRMFKYFKKDFWKEFI